MSTMSTKTEYLDKATAAFAVSDNLRYDYEDRNLAARQAVAAATIALVQELCRIKKRLLYIGTCLADIAADKED